jgi:hypothetical protein
MMTTTSTRLPKGGRQLWGDGALDHEGNGDVPEDLNVLHNGEMNQHASNLTSSTLDCNERKYA